MKALDIEAVQAFLMVADFRSFTRAAEALESTQSTVSLKIKRLENGLGRRLFDRTPRHVRLSSDGNLFLASARALVAAHQGALGAFGVQKRRLVVGISHHVGGSNLPALLRQMGRAEPGLVMEMRVAMSRQILDDFDRGDLDAAIVLRNDNRRRDGEVIFEEGFTWRAARDFVHRAGEALPLAMQADPCTVRNMALEALNGGGIPWTEAFIGGGIPAIGAAVSAGIAIAALGHRVAPAETVNVGPLLGLPALPSRDVMLYTKISDLQGQRGIRALAAAIRNSAG